MQIIEITSPEQIKSWLWVIKALNQDPNRPVLQSICVSECGSVVATDGGRLHKWNPEVLPEGMTPGVYSVVSKSAKLIVLKNQSEEFTFPNWKQVIPRGHDNKITLGDSKIGVSSKSAIGAVMLETVTLIDSDNITDALGFGTLTSRKASRLVGVTCTWEDETGKNPVCLFPENDKQAVLMPIRCLIQRDFVPINYM